MRVLVIVHGFPPSAEGGAEIYAHAHASVLQRSFGDEVLVLTREADPNRAECAVRTECCDGLTVLWLNNTYRETRCFEDTYRSSSMASAAVRVIDDYRPEVAHIHHLTNLSTSIVHALAVRRIPAIVTLHDYWFMCHRGQLLDTDLRVCEGPGPAGCGRCLAPAAGAGPLTFAGARVARALARIGPSVLTQPIQGAASFVATAVANRDRSGQQATMRLAHMHDVCAEVSHFIAPSHHLCDRFVAFGIPPARITVSRYGIDHAPFRDLARTRGDRLRVGFFGSLMVSKAPHVLLDAVRRLPAGTLSVDLYGACAPYHGDDSYRQQIAARLPQPGVRVHGAIPHGRVAEMLASIDVLVVPSIWPENSPLVIQEAFLAGVPVVASRIGGIPEQVVDEVNGLLVRAGDADDLARALGRLLHEPGLLDALRRGVPGVRPIEDDVAAARGLYRKAIAEISRESPQPASPAIGRPRLAAVVLNYRTPDDTLLAVKSLLALRRPPDDLIVVNNDADAATAQALTPVAGRITYLHTGRNLGYSGGMNIGIRHALGRGAGLVALVNSDVTVPPDCLERLAECLAAMPSAGIAGPVVLSRTAPDRIASLGMSFHARTGRMRHFGVGTRLNDRRPPSHAVVDGVSGCLILIASRVFETIGLLDEDYFFSFEDLDFCLRARQRGFLTVLAGNAFAHHEGGRSIGATSPSRLYFAARNHLRLASGRTSAGRIEVLARTVSIVALNVAHAVRSPGASLPVRLGAVARGSLDYFAGRSGSGRFAG